MQRRLFLNTSGMEYYPGALLMRKSISGAYLKVAGFSHFNSVAPPVRTNYYEQDLYLTGGLVLLKRLTLEGG